MATARKSIKKSASTVKEAPVTSEKETTQSKPNNTVKYYVLPLIAGAIIGLGIGYALQNLQPAAIVNGESISKQVVYADLLKQGGQKILDNKITETLILQEARKKNVTATDKEVNDRIGQIDKEIQAKGQNLDTLLKAQGQTRNDLNYQIKIQILVEKMLGASTKVTDAEIKEYFEKNKEAYGKDATLENKTAEIKQGLEQQKLAEKFQEWIEKVKSQAKITNFIKS